VFTVRQKLKQEREINKMAAGYNGTKTPEEIRDLWATPQWVFDYFNQEFLFDLDAAANEINAKCVNFLTEKDNSLELFWGRYLDPKGTKTVWINPPYSDIGPWCHAAANHAKDGITTGLFVPNTPDASWWPNNASEIRLITGFENPNGRNISGRIQFVRADTGEKQSGNTKGSCFILFAPNTLGNMTTKYIGIEKIMPAAQVARYNRKTTKKSKV